MFVENTTKIRSNKHSPSIHFPTPSIPHTELRGAYPSHFRAKAGYILDIAGPTEREKQAQITDNLELPIKLMSMSLDCEGKLEYPERIHAATGRTCKIHAKGVGIEPTTF